MTAVTTALEGLIDDRPLTEEERDAAVQWLLTEQKETTR